MKHFRVTFFFLVVALTLSGCGIFGGSDGTDLSAGEDVTPPPTVNNVQQLPAAEEPATGSEQPAAEDTADDANATLPTAVTLPTAAPTPEPTVDRSQPTSYVVQSGDVLGLIAERFDADIAELRRVNGLDGNLIQVGQTLTIPAADGSTETAAEAPEATAVPASSGSSGSGSSSSAPVSCNSAATGHCVQPGESLLGIALKYDITVEALRAANPGITGDLIKSGEVLNLPGSTTTSPDPVATSAPAPSSGTPVPQPTVGPANDADCEARNPEFPYFHAADGLCYANPIGGATAVPTVAGGDADQDCGPGRFLWEDGLCYPIPGVTVTPTPGPTTDATSTSSGSTEVDYGRPPCDPWEVVLITTNKCWPDGNATDAQKEEGRVKTGTATPVPTATP